MKNVYFFLLILFLTKSAYAIEFQGKFIQGHFIIGKTDPKTKVWIDKNKVRTSDDGYFVFGIDRDRKYDVVITLNNNGCLLYTSPSPRDRQKSRMPSSA